MGKRFTNSGVKVNTQVGFAPHEPLDLTRFLDPCAPREPVNYQLYAAIYHSGGAHYGHYVAVCRHEGDGRWYLYNDDTVTVCSPPQPNGAYLLFYQRLRPGST
eukprot:NODE_5178_length_526_cov_124.150943_g3830_i0.p1 GENE.NODE_5178_length_526_cov_124.150943_g3830_i0~~NODE_5178_length_526_cov_124.150943_g3830_i0.p1  ORF type:complete len:111 (-),score=35.16 NODE_5178_length_526_cov_124.150943_g3830_i0:194-502(-)